MSPFDRVSFLRNKAKRRESQVKRRAAVPRPALSLAEQVSKADLLEAAWAMAGLLNDAGSVDDEASTLSRLFHELDEVRVQRGARRIRLLDALAGEKIR